MPILRAHHAGFFDRHPDLAPPAAPSHRRATVSTLKAFGDEWHRFPEMHAVHAKIFEWYFEGGEPPQWSTIRVLDAGCGMGRWLHYARQQGGCVVGMDVSPAIDVVARREAGDLVQADLRHPPFAPGSFDLVYCLGVLHHLEDPELGLRALAGLVRPGGALRFYVYRTLDDEPAWRRGLLRGVTALRALTVRMPYWAVHTVATMIALLATPLSLWPRRCFRRFAWGERLTRLLPLAQYADVPFRMFVAEQFDRLVAPLEGRYAAHQVEAWVAGAGLELVSVLPGLGWRVIARKPD